MGEKVKLRNQLASFWSFCCVQLAVHLGMRFVVLKLVHALNPNRLLCFICRDFHRLFMAHLLHICFCWMVLFIYEDGISWKDVWRGITHVSHLSVTFVTQCALHKSNKCYLMWVFFSFGYTLWACGIPIVVHYIERRARYAPIGYGM